MPPTAATGLAPYSPSRAPLLWIMLNGICCVAAVGILILAECRDEVGGKQVSETYLIYNFLICTVWLVEIGMYVRYDEPEEAAQVDAEDAKCACGMLGLFTAHAWYTWLELLVALYFVIDCAVSTYQWHWQVVRAWEIYFDSGMDLTFYVYYLVRAIQALLRASASPLEDDDDDDDNDDAIIRIHSDYNDKNSGSTPYLNAAALVDGVRNQRPPPQDSAFELV